MRDRLLPAMSLVRYLLYVNQNKMLVERVRVGLQLEKTPHYRPPSFLGQFPLDSPFKLLSDPLEYRLDVRELGVLPLWIRQCSLGIIMMRTAFLEQSSLGVKLKFQFQGLRDHLKVP